MDTAKLMRPLFSGGNFNVNGRRKRSIFVREVTNGTDVYRLWRNAGKPDLDYPRAENDAYILYVEFGEYLAPLKMTEFSLIDHCGYPAAIKELYGDKDKRSAYFRQLRESGPNWEQVTSKAIARERERIQQLGSDPARQADYIKSIMDQHVSTYLASKESCGQSFPDFIGALVLDDLFMCQSLSFVYRQKIYAEEQARKAKAEAEEKARKEEQNRVSKQAVQDAIHTIQNGGVLENKTVKFYLRYYYDGPCSIVNYLMRKYQVYVPARTQGWISNKLVSVTIENGRCEHLKYMRAKGGQCSQRFFDCMNELIQKVTTEAVPELEVG
ncbi:MAG: hypothetical protein ACI3W5_05055 [Faecousia sp.]